MGPVRLGSASFRRLGHTRICQCPGSRALWPAICHPLSTPADDGGPPRSADTALRPAGRERRGYGTDRGLGARHVVWAQWRRGHLRTQLSRRALARCGARRVQGGARCGRRHGSRWVHQVLCRGGGCCRLPVPRILRSAASCRAGPAVISSDAQGDVSGLRRRLPVWQKTDFFSVARRWRSTATSTGFRRYFRSRVCI